MATLRQKEPETIPFDPRQFSHPCLVRSSGFDEAVAAQISALEDAGVTDFVAGEYADGDDQPRTRALLQSLARQASS